MAFYRQSPSRSPYKSRLEEKELIEEELHLKKVLRVEGENRRLADELSILRLKLRKLEELEDKYDGLLKNNAMLAQSNDQLAAELAERRYEIQRLKVGTVQAQEREIIKNSQLLQVNQALEMEVELLKKERFESSKVYEDHIAKMEMLLEEKVKELEILGMNFDKLANQKEIGEIRNEEERNKLKNEIARTSYQKERELEVSKEKQFNEKVIEIETLKRNHASQILILEDEIQKLKKINEIKMGEFEGQLIQNRNLKLGYEEELAKMGEENDALRIRMAKLEELNRSEVESIQQKYNSIHSEGTSSLKEQHGNEVRLLLSELDRQKWLLNDKNAEIQQLVKEKRELRQANEERQLELNDEINVLKGQLSSQQDKRNQEAHELFERINSLEDRMLRDSESYHERVKHFTNQIEELEAEGKRRQANHERSKREWQLHRNQVANERDTVRQELLDTKKALAERTNELEAKKRAYDEYKQRNERQKERLSKLLNQLELKNEQLQEKLDTTSSGSERDIQLLTQELDSYKRTNEKLESALKQLQSKFTAELGELSQAHRAEVNRIEAAYRLRITELERTLAELKSSLENQVRLAQRKLEDKESQLKGLLEKYARLDAHFKDPSKWVEFDPRGCSSIFEAVRKTKESAVKIF